jgi:hypothetical protein
MWLAISNTGIEAGRPNKSSVVPSHSKHAARREHSRPAAGIEKYL